MSDYTIIGRQGHMEDGEHVSDEVAVLVVDGDDQAIGRAPTVEEAVVVAQEQIHRFRVEQEVLNHPDVAAARQAYQDAIQKAKEAS